MSAEGSEATCMAKLGDISAQGRSSLILALVLVLSALLIFSAFVVADPASPGKPSLIYPADGAYENDNTPTFRWENGAGADNHRLLVDNDSNFSSPNENRIIFDNFYTLAQENSLPDGTYYWKVIAINADGENESAIRTFVIDTVAPPFMALLSPADNSIMLTNTPTFTWGMVADPSGVTYTIQIDNDQDFPSLTHENSGLVNNSYTLPGSAALPSGKYYWRVRAVDGAGNQGTWSDVWRLTVDGVPPVVSSWKITKIIGGSENLVDFENGTYTNDNTPFISAIVTDDAAGVKDNMQLLLDGNVVSHTYHPENGQVCHQVPSEFTGR